MPDNGPRSSNSVIAPSKLRVSSDLDKDILKVAMMNKEVIIITLGITENPLRVRFLGPAKTPLNIRSEGTRLAIETMKELNIKRLLVQTSYGTGPSKNMLRFIEKLFFKLLLKPQMDDTEKQDNYIIKIFFCSKICFGNMTTTNKAYFKNFIHKELYALSLFAFSFFI